MNDDKLRQELRRAVDYAPACYGSLRQEGRGSSPHSSKISNVRGQIILENGALETVKKERVRTRMELVETSGSRTLRK